MHTVLSKAGPTSTMTLLFSCCNSSNLSSSWWIVNNCSTLEKRMPKSLTVTSFRDAIGFKNTSMITSRSFTYSRSVLRSSYRRSWRWTSFSGIAGTKIIIIIVIIKKRI